MAQLFKLTSTPLDTDAKAERIYQEYPRRVGKAAALTSIRRALKKESFDELLEATVAYSKACAASKREMRLIPHPSTWFNQERWKDDRRDWEQDNDFEATAAFQRLRTYVARVGPGERIPAPRSGKADFAKAMKVAEFCGLGAFRRGEVTLKMWIAAWKSVRGQ